MTGVRGFLVVLMLALSVSSCVGDGVDTGDVSGFPTATIELDSEPLLVAVAANRDDRIEGLRGVSDLGVLDGMLFVFDDPVATSFTMRDVPIDLDVGFFDETGTLFEVRMMTACEAAPCPSYETGRPVSAALERPAGGFEGVPLGAVLDFELP
jgi:uncharacterized membrane protein (UPF0127 family)